MAETGAMTAYLKDIAILEKEATRRAQVLFGGDYDAVKHRGDFLKLRKDVLHEIISQSKYGNENT